LRGSHTSDPHPRKAMFMDEHLFQTVCETSAGISKLTRERCLLFFFAVDLIQLCSFDLPV
jgi:hypothetical protein